MQTKKSKIISLFFMCGIAVFAFSCKRPPCNIETNTPEDVKPIDWDNYNSIYTVFWNIFKNDCSGSGFPTGDTIKIYGKIDKFESGSSKYRFFQLIDEQEHKDNFIYDHLYDKYKYFVPSVRVFIYPIADKLKSITDSIDITNRKCYIKGELSTILIGGEVQTAELCCFTVPAVILHNIDDIYFEE